MCIDRLNGRTIAAAAVGSLSRGVVIASLFGLLLPAVAAGSERPNIVFVMTDDQGYWDTGATGNPHIDTPQMDRIAAEGMKLSRYYAAPVCAPTRAGVMTGRYYLRTGLYNTRFGGDSLGLQETTVAELLREAGYRTGLFGKWHLGKYPDYQPQRRGFEEFFGHYHGHIERYEFPDQLHRNGQPVEARGYVSDLFTDAAIDFVQSPTTDNRPFFCALMYNAPHSPFLLDTSHFGQPEGDELLDKYLKKGLPLREARIYGLIERVDQNLGRLLETLDQQGIADNTLVVFTSDNGGVSKFWKGGMNGQKSSPYEGGVRAPCFVRWPERIRPNSESHALTSHIDWLPTFCEAAGLKIPSGLSLDGRSLIPVLTQDQEEHHSYVYHTWDRYTPNPDFRWGISDERWKLIGIFRAEATPDPRKWRLYDLKDDPGETKNVLMQHREIVQRLRKEFVRWFDDVTDGQTYQPVRIPVGDDLQPETVISPSWSTWHGEHIRYEFEGYDWDTIEGWKTPGENAVWRLNVKQPGSYRVQISYGCRPQDAGGMLGLSVGAKQLTYKVEATATGNQFQTDSVGVIELPAGETELVAEVLSAPGDELMRLRHIKLTRLNQ